MNSTRSGVTECKMITRKSFTSVLFMKLNKLVWYLICLYSDYNLSLVK